MPNVWTIHRGDVTGGPTGSSLHRCRIKTNDTDTAYLLVKNNDQLSSTNTNSLPATPFTFEGFPLAGYTWNLTVDTLVGGASGNQAQGTWNNDAQNPTQEEDGTFTAQAGSGVDADSSGDGADDTTAASA